jgi:hypothetical protein
VAGVWVGSEWLATDRVEEVPEADRPSAPTPASAPVVRERETEVADPEARAEDVETMEFTVEELLGPDDPDPLPEVADPTPQRVQRRGQVNIATPGGWADVYLGEQRVGRSPGTIRLRPGSYRLRLLPFGRGPEKAATIHVRPGQRTRVIVPLDR